VITIKMCDCVIEQNSKWGYVKNNHRSYIKGKTITANNVFITSKVGTWELLINYFKQHYGNERTAADYLKWPFYLSSHSSWKWLGLNRPCFHYQIIQEVIYQQWFRWHGKWGIVCWTLWQIRHWLQRRRRIVWFWINIAGFSASYSYTRVWL